MIKNLVPLMFIVVVLSIFSTLAKADNAFTQDQLIKMTQASLLDYSTNQPDMAKSISGFKATTAAPDVKIIIYMNADGMNMTANYLCVPAEADFSCHFQN